MSELVFATYLKELKNAWAEEIADPDLINLLYDAVSEPMELVNKENGTITTEKSAASKIVNRQKGGNALKVIRTNANKDKVRSSIEQYFEKNVVKRLHSDCIDDLISNLKKIIEGDSSISETKKEELLKNASRNKLAAFLGFTYLYSLTRDNVLKEIRIKTTQEIEDYKRHPLREIPTPPEVIEEERKYADALMTVYGQAEGIPNFDESMLAGFPKHQQHFSDQRGYYFAAEAVRRGTRDIYSDESQFDVLKNETYEGVKEVWEEEYKSGYWSEIRICYHQTVLAELGGVILDGGRYFTATPDRDGISLTEYHNWDVPYRYMVKGRLNHLVHEFYYVDDGDEARHSHNEYEGCILIFEDEKEHQRFRIYVRENWYRKDAFANDIWIPHMEQLPGYNMDAFREEYLNMQILRKMLEEFRKNDNTKN